MDASDERRLREMGRRALNSAAKAGGSSAPPGLSRRRARVTADNGDGTLNVDLGSDAHPEPMLGLRMTTGCRGVSVGDVVLVETLNHVSYIVGVIANSTNRALPISGGGTGSSSRGTALSNLMVSGYVNSDFNNYTTPGCYTVNRASSYANYPTAGGRACYNWGVLQVIPGGNAGTVVQIYWPDKTNQSPYFRTTGWSAWRGWTRIASALEIYPVGAVYISYVSTSPASLFGGTWTPITGRFPYFNAGTGTGGSNTHTLTVNEMPAHNHAWQGVNDGASAPGSPGTYPFRIYQDKAINWDGTQASMKTAGGGQAHNNMPAYQSFYAWRRTA